MRWLTVKLAVLSAWATAAAGAGLPDAHKLTARASPNYSSLKCRLSKNAEVLLPGSDAFTEASARWSALEEPIANAVVVPATENDVVETIKFANAYSLPYLATNGVHGSITTLGKMTSGIEIYLAKLNTVEIAADGKTAKIGGGILSKNLTDALWAAGKQTVTGTCECVGYMGPALGGGHGWLQGHHGLVSDQFVSMRVVLANGSVVTVDSKNPDLFWAMKGAGHNFGIVTSVTSKIYDIEHPNYAMETLFFTGDQVEAVYQTANDNWLTNGSQPVDLINWSYWFFDPTIDAEKPVIAMYIIQEGVDVVDPAYTAPFYSIGPIINSSVSGDYRDLAAWTGISVDATPCQKTGNANPRFPIYLKSYNPAAQKEVYELFRQATTNASTPFSNALFMFEGYSQQGVKAVGDDATAFAYRSDNLLVAPLLTYTPAGPELDQTALELGNKIRQVLFEGSGESTLNTYVNYAYGDETPTSWYGSDAGRQNRLKAVKQSYDPKGKFSFYGPIM
ncbi:FAD binding domain-containing protein [Hypomontagnella monticulosa]|nr:FAD binding domain-containing protein [Hypomontagnella monticulosa]